jgi:3-deoxy-manno-octulosonate cytidylyltransferase (CMP-KDO synthetase)
LEQQEQLEQLRWLEAGMAIRLLESTTPSLGVDTPEDAQQVSRILQWRQIRGLLCDVDGVLTDGRLWYGPEGEQLKPFHARDGSAIQQLMQRGIAVAVVSGRDSPALRRRMADLGIRHGVLGQPDKAAACRQIAAELGLVLETLAYVGDDSLDLPGMACCGWSFAVADAPEAVQLSARSVLRSRGGEGAIREVAELLLGVMP